MRAFFQQPYFFPWIGFFIKLALCDIYIVLDDARYRRNHISRVQLLNNYGKPKWITIPAKKSQNMLIRQVLIKNQHYFKNYLEKYLVHMYKRAAYFKSEFPHIKRLLDKCFTEGSTTALNDLNLCIIRELVAIIKINPPKFIMRSQLQYDHSSRTKSIIDICDQLKIETLIYGDGSFKEVHDLKKIESTNVILREIPCYSNHPKYTQFNSKSGFIKGLSIVDTLLNIGSNSTKDLILDFAND